MKSRLIASVVLGTAVLLTATGCNFLAPQATTYEYDAGDGVSANTGDLEIRNVFIVSEDGKDGNLIAAIINSDTEAAATLRIEFGEDGKGGKTTVRIPAAALVSLGGEGATGDDPILLEGINAKPGTVLPMYFQSGSGEGELVLVPVLDGTLPYYEGLVP